MSGYPRLVFRQFTKTAETKVLVHFRKQNTQVQRTQVTRITIIPKTKLFKVFCSIEGSTQQHVPQKYYKKYIKTAIG